MKTRRNLFKHILWILILAECFPLLAIAGSQQKEQRYKIAVCDWMILKRQKIGSFQLVHELNGDGVELDMGALAREKCLIINCGNLIFSSYFVKLLKNIN